MPYGYSLKLVPAGLWTPDGVYVAGQVLTRNGSTYWAHRTPTVGNDPEINSPDEWQLLAAKGTKGDRGDVVWRGPHSMGTLYEIDDACESGGSAWIATVQNQGHSPPDPAYWDLFAAGGTQGPAGSAWYVGSGVPSVETGSDGDRYLDGVTGNVYAKADGAWTLAGSLKGPAGADGACSIRVIDEAGKLSGALDYTMFPGSRYIKTGGAGVTSIDGHGLTALSTFELVASKDLTLLDLHGCPLSALTLTVDSQVDYAPTPTLNFSGCGLSAANVAVVLAAAVAMDTAARGNAAGGTLDIGGNNAPLDFSNGTPGVSGDISPDITGATWTRGEDVNGSPSWNATVGETTWYISIDSSGYWQISTTLGQYTEPGWTQMAPNAGPNGTYDIFQSYATGGPTVSTVSYPQPAMDYEALVSTDNGHTAWTVTQPS